MVYPTLPPVPFPAWPNATVIQGVLLFAVRGQFDVLAAIAKVPVDLPEETWTAPGFSVKVHCPAAEPQKITPANHVTNRIKVLKPRFALEDTVSLSSSQHIPMNRRPRTFLHFGSTIAFCDIP